MKPVSNNNKIFLAQFKLNYKMFIALFGYVNKHLFICNILQIHDHRNTNEAVCQLMKNKLRLAVFHCCKLLRFILSCK